MVSHTHVNKNLNHRHFLSESKLFMHGIYSGCIVKNILFLSHLSVIAAWHHSLCSLYPCCSVFKKLWTMKANQTIFTPKPKMIHTKLREAQRLEPYQQWIDKDKLIEPRVKKQTMTSKFIQSWMCKYVRNVTTVVTSKAHWYETQ